MPSYDQILDDARIALFNGRDDADIQAHLARRGYDIPTLDTGIALWTTANEAQVYVQKERGEQHAATDTLAKAWTHADALYSEHLEFARPVFREDRAAITALALAGRRKRSLAGWIAQATQFYANALGTDRYTEALAGVGITREELEDGQARVQAVATADAAQEGEKGDAQRAKTQRDAALDALDTYMDRYLGIARATFRNDPQSLEKLGLLARSD